MNTRPACLSLLLSLLLISGCGDNKNNENKEQLNLTMQTILNRKSVREYTERVIAPELINDLLRAGMAAPSSRDRRPWEFIVIDDKAVLQSLGSQLPTASCLKDANKAIAVCGNIETSDNCWFLDCSAAVQNILLAAESMHLGAVWTTVYPYEDRAVIAEEVLALPSNIKVLAIIPLGYPKGKHSPKDKFDKSRIHYNKW